MIKTFLIPFNIFKTFYGLKLMKLARTLFYDVTNEVSHPDHLLADSHELEVELWVHHFRLLQSEDLLMALLGQVLLAFFQTLNHLNVNKHTD